MTAEVFDTSDSEALRHGLRQARLALGAKQVVVIPTDTHYALAVDGFSAAGLEALASAKRWESPPIPQLLLPGTDALVALAEQVHPVVSKLTEAFWPGPLTVVVNSSSTLRWNLGQHVGAVGLRMTDHPVAAELLIETGPLLVSAAHPAGETVASLEECLEKLGEQVAVVLVDPELAWGPGSSGSSVVDARGLTGSSPSLALLREGALTTRKLGAVAGPDLTWVEA